MRGNGREGVEGKGKDGEGEEGKHTQASNSKTAYAAPPNVFHTTFTGLLVKYILQARYISYRPTNSAKSSNGKLLTLGLSYLQCSSIQGLTVLHRSLFSAFLNVLSNADCVHFVM